MSDGRISEVQSSLQLRLHRRPLHSWKTMEPLSYESLFRKSLLAAISCFINGNKTLQTPDQKWNRLFVVAHFETLTAVFICPAVLLVSDQIKFSLGPIDIYISLTILLADIGLSQIHGYWHKCSQICTGIKTVFKARLVHELVIKSDVIA